MSLLRELVNPLPHGIGIVEVLRVQRRELNRFARYFVIDKYCPYRTGRLTGCTINAVEWMHKAHAICVRSNYAVNRAYLYARLIHHIYAGVGNNKGHSFRVSNTAQ